MDIQRSAQPDRSASAFLVERYLPRSAVGDLVPSVRRVRRICSAQGVEGTVRYVQSIYLPGEDICFCVFQAASSDAVRAVNDIGGFSFDRVTAAILMIAPGPGPADQVSGPAAPLASDHDTPRTSA